MYEYSLKLGARIASTCEDFIINDEEVQKKYYMIFKKLPEIYQVLEEYLGGPFSDLVEKSIKKWGKKK
jgi:hypothetical protein